MPLQIRLTSCKTCVAGILVYFELPFNVAEWLPPIDACAELASDLGSAPKKDKRGESNPPPLN